MENLVINTVARNALTKPAVLLLGMIGSALVTRSLATEDQVNQALDPIAHIVVGIALSGGAVGIALIRAQLKRKKELALRTAASFAVEVNGKNA